MSHDSQGDRKNNTVKEAPVPDSGSAAISNNEGRKLSREDIELVQNLIERCLLLYMNKDEVVKTLMSRARIDPGFTTLVWQKLEEENAEFFRAYYIRLKVKKQIDMFNHLIQHQFHLMKYPVAPKIPLGPMQNGIHPMPVGNLPMGYPVLQQPPVATTGQPHLDGMGGSLSSCHVVNGVPALGNYHPLRTNGGSDALMGRSAGEVGPSVPPCNAMSEMALSPTSATSNDHFPFNSSEMLGMSVDASVLDSTFNDVVNSLGHYNGVDNGRDSFRSLANIPWNFSFPDLTADLPSLGDLGSLENYPGAPFLPSDSDLFLNSPDQDDIEEFFVDSIPEQGSQSDEEKPAVDN